MRYIRRKSLAASVTLAAAAITLTIAAPSAHASAEDDVLIFKEETNSPICETVEFVGTAYAYFPGEANSKANEITKAAAKQWGEDYQWFGKSLVSSSASINALFMYTQPAEYQAQYNWKPGDKTYQGKAREVWVFCNSWP